MTIFQNSTAQITKQKKFDYKAKILPATVLIKSLILHLQLSCSFIDTVLNTLTEDLSEKMHITRSPRDFTLPYHIYRHFKSQTHGQSTSSPAQIQNHRFLFLPSAPPLECHPSANSHRSRSAIWGAASDRQHRSTTSPLLLCPRSRESCQLNAREREGHHER